MFLTYNDAKGYSEAELRGMGLFPAGNGNWMDADTAIGLGYPATAFGTGGVQQMQGYNVDSLNKLVSDQSTANFNKDMAAKSNIPTTQPDSLAALAGNAGTGGASQVKSAEVAKEPSLLDKGLEWLGDNTGKVTGAVAGGLIAGPAGAAVGSKLGDTIQNKVTVNDKIDAGLKDAFGGVDAAEKTYKTSSPGTMASVDQMSKMLENDPSKSIDFGLSGTSTPSIGTFSKGIENNIDFGLKNPTTGNYVDPKNFMTDSLTASLIAGPQITPETGITNTPIKSNGLANPIGNTTVDFTSNLNMPNLNQGNTGINTISTPGEVISGLPIPANTLTPTTPTTPTTNNYGLSTGELPQFRKQLNRALGEAKNAAIMRGTPLTEKEISGAVEGLAEGATNRLNEAQRIQIIKDQMATAKDQWEKGFLSDNAYRDKVLELQQKWAELGYKMDVNQIKKDEKNQDYGNIIGAISLLNDLWG